MNKYQSALWHFVNQRLAHGVSMLTHTQSILAMKVYECTWTFIGFHGKKHGFSWQSIENHQCSWIFMKINFVKTQHFFWCISMKVHGQNILFLGLSLGCKWLRRINYSMIQSILIYSSPIYLTDCIRIYHTLQ